MRIKHALEFCHVWIGILEFPCVVSSSYLVYAQTCARLLV